MIESSRRSIGRRRMRPQVLVGVLAGAIAALTAGPAHALDQGCVAYPRDNQVAERLTAMAETEMRENGSWMRAAELMVDAANSRPTCDPERYNALRLAAKYLQFAGEPGKASHASYEAGVQGVRAGDPAVAATAFIEAATFALEARDFAMARCAARRAAVLAESPLLTPVQRIAIRGRADYLLRAGGA